MHLRRRAVRRFIRDIAPAYEGREVQTQVNRVQANGEQPPLPVFPKRALEVYSAARFPWVPSKADRDAVVQEEPL
jgi:hypothetical protein